MTTELTIKESTGLNGHDIAPRMAIGEGTRFKEIVPAWIEYKRGIVKKSTCAIYMLCIRKHILPEFGEWKIKDMTKNRIKPVILSWLDTKKLSRSTLSFILVVIKNVLGFCSTEMEMDGVPNLRWKMEWPTYTAGSKSKVDRYDKHQLSKLIDYCEKQPSYKSLGIILACCTGLRIGELCGLKWKDVDFNKKSIRVNRTLERIAVEDDKGGVLPRTTLHISEPKTINSRRTIPLIPQAFKMVQNFNKVNRADYYILSGSLKPIEPSTFRRYYTMITEDIGLPKVKFHGLRHTFASVLVEEGVDVKTVSSILGHADTAITLNLYCHPTDEGKANAIKTGLASVFGEGNDALRI